MRNLSAEQKERLSDHIANKPIKYIELYNELYDHYASAYETGDFDFPTTLKELDQHFTDKKVDDINGAARKKTQKTINQLAWEEFKSFWKWPQVLCSSMFLIAILILFYQLNTDIIKYFLIPALLASAIVMILGFVLNRKSIRGKKFKSAYVESCSHILNLPVSLVNLSIFLPVLVGHEGNRFDLFKAYPFLPSVLFLLVLFSLLFTYRLYQTKIKLQFI